MIIIIFFLFFSLLVIEFWNYKTRKINTGLISDIKRNDFNLEILKALSFLPQSKNLEIEADLRGVFTSFVNQYLQNNLRNLWPKMIVILENSNPGVYRFCAKEDVSEVDIEKSNQLNDLEKKLISVLQAESKFTNNAVKVVTKENPALSDATDIKTALVGSLKYQNDQLGYLISLSPDIGLNETSNDFYSSVANVVSLLVIKFYNNQTLPKEEQLKAVTFKW